MMKVLGDESNAYQIGLGALVETGWSVGRRATGADAMTYMGEDLALRLCWQAQDGKGIAGRDSKSPVVASGHCDWRWILDRLLARGLPEEDPGGVEESSGAAEGSWWATTKKPT